MKKYLLFASLVLSGYDIFAQSQFAGSVIAFSSQFSSPSWSAAQALGAPNTNGCGDYTTAWASQTGDGQREFLVLGFNNPQQVASIRIYETYRPGAIDTVYLRDASTGIFNMVYQTTAVASSICPRVLTIDIPLTSYLVDAIRIAVNSPVVPSWNEIDAVEISSQPTSLNKVDMLNLHQFRIVGKPNRDVLLIDAGSETNAHVYDLTGKLCATFNLLKGVNRLNLREFSCPPGIYTLMDAETGAAQRFVLTE